MRQWYCVVNGVRYGPVEEAVLHSWAMQGRVTAETLLWSEDFAEWQAADQVFAEWFAAGPFPPVPPVTPKVRTRAPPGTGGMRPNCELMADARECLRGRWGLAIAFSLLLALIQGALGAVPFAGMAVALVLGGPFVLGETIFYLTYARRGRGELSMLFVGFQNFGNALGTYLLRFLFVFLWSLLLVIPGIVAALAYSQAMYLLAENPGLDPLAAIRRSKKMMRGHKGKLFCLYLRFLGWAILCLLTFGIGFIFLSPYLEISLARFHDDLRREADGAPVAPEFRGPPPPPTC